MPRIPNEYLGKKFAQLKETVKNKNKLLTTVMALIIFVVCTIEIISYKLPDIVTAKQYREFYFPFLCTLELFILSLFFVFKAYRYTACLETKITSILFAISIFISLIALVFQFTPQNYLILIQPIIIVAVLLLILINTIKWFSK